MKHLGDYAAATVLYGSFTTYRPSTGAAYALAGTPILSIYKDDSAAQWGTVISVANGTLSNPDSIAGFNVWKLDTGADGTFFATGHVFHVVITTGTVDSVDIAGSVVATFTIGLASAAEAAIQTKTDYLPSITAGDAGGVFIAGTNAPVTITGSGNALTLTSTGAGGHGLTATGHTTGYGIRATGAAGLFAEGTDNTGYGIVAYGSGTSGNGMGMIATGAGIGLVTAGASGISAGEIIGDLTGSVGSVVSHDVVIRGAVGMATANLDTQLANLATDITNISVATNAGDLTTKVADAATLTTGSTISGTFADTATDNNTFWITAPVTPAVGGFGLRQQLEFDLPLGRVPINILIRGYWNGSGQVVDVYALNSRTAVYDKLTNTGTNLASRSNELLYTIPLPRDYAEDAGGSFNVVMLELRSASTNTGHRLRVDQMLVSHINEAASGTFTGITTDQVWTYATRTLTTPGADPVDLTGIIADLVAVKATTDQFVFTIPNEVDANGLDEAGIRTAIGMASANLDTQLADLPTNAELATALGTADDATLAAIAGIAAKTNQLTFTVANQVDANAITISSGNLGAGAITWTYTVTNSSGGAPIADVDIWVTEDSGGQIILASGRTDAYGVVTFYLDAGTVYIWRQKSGWNFANPDTETVT